MTRRVVTILLTLCLTFSAATAWAFWSAGSVAGGNGASAVTTVNKGATPTASVVGNAVTLTWTPTTLTSGRAVSGYAIKRYAGSTPMTILTACTGRITSTSCVENNVPTGVWTYSVTPLFATNWAGLESDHSSTVVVGNVAPVAVADSYSTPEDAVLTVAASGVLGNDSDPNNNPLTAVLVSGVANGTLSLAANGGFSYTPNPNFNGSDSFAYKANDGTQNGNTISVGLTVTAVNDAPLNSLPGTQQTAMNTNLVLASATNNAISISDPDAGAANVQVQLTAIGGTVTLAALANLTFSAGDGASDATMTFSGTIADINSRLNGAIFTPTTGTNGSATLQVVTSDLGNTGSGGPQIDTDSVTINVNALGIFTDKRDIGAPGVTGSSSFATPVYTVVGSGSDIWNNADQFQFLSRSMTGDGRLTARVVSQAQSGGANNTAKAGVMFRDTTAPGSINGMMTVTQANGSEFTWRLTTDGASTVSQVTAGIVAPYWVRLTRVGSLLTAARSSDGTNWVQQGSQNVPMSTTLLAGLAVTAVNPAKLNTAKFDNVKLTTPPTAVANTYTTNEDQTLTVAARGVLADDTDPEGDAMTAILVATTAGLTFNSNGSFTYVPPSNFSGAASFSYKANDGVFDSNIVTVNLRVNPHNEVPSFVKGANQSVVQAPGAQTLAGWATAISQGAGETGQLVEFVTTNDNNSLFSVQPAVTAIGTLTYTPAGTTGVANVSVRIQDNGGTANGGSDRSADQTFTITITPDTTGPTGGSVDASGLVGTGSRYATTRTLSLVLAEGIDPNAVAATGNLVKRATATMASADGTCGSFGSYAVVAGGTDPVSPMSDTVSDQACYRYQYVVSDTLGNSTTFTSPDIKVDLTPPTAPSLTHSAFTNSYWSSGSIVYYRSAASAGSFKTTATSTDSASGIASYAFPALGTNWTSSGSLGVRTYTWSTGPAAPGASVVTATNNATGVSSSASFTPTADDTAPSAGTVTPPNGTQASTAVSVTYATGTDDGSGVGTRLLQRQSVALTGTTCGSFPAQGTGWTTAVSDPESSPYIDTVTAGFCYKYRYVVADNVGNLSTANSENVVKVTVRTAYFDVVRAQFGLVNYYRLDEAASSSPIRDVQVAGNNGTYVGTPTMAQPGAITDTGNTAVQFNGTSQYGTAARQISGNFSIEFWLKSTQDKSYDGAGQCSSWWQGAGLVDADASGTASDFGISLCSGRIIAGVGGPDTSIVTADKFNDGVWHHVVFTRTRYTGAMALYVDGAAVGTATGSTNLLTSQATIAFGRSAVTANGFYFHGSMDEIALYNSALSAATIAAHYNAR